MQNGKAQHRYFVIWVTMYLASELGSRDLKLPSWEMLTPHLVKCSGFCVFTASTSTLHLNKYLYLMIAPYLFLTVLIRIGKYLCCTAWSIAPGHQLSRNDISWILLIKIHTHLVIHINLMSPRLKMSTWIRGMWSDSPKRSTARKCQSNEWHTNIFFPVPLRKYPHWIQQEVIHYIQYSAHSSWHRHSEFIGVMLIYTNTIASPSYLFNLKYFFPFFDLIRVVFPLDHQ